MALNAMQEGDRRAELQKIRRDTEKKEQETNLGDILGWYNESMDQEKITDVEMYLGCGMDIEFIKTYHRLRDVLEANAFYRLHHKIEGFSDAESVREIFKRLANGQSLEVNLKVGSQDPNLKDKIPETIDLRQLARLVRMKKFNKLMGVNRFSEPDLEKRFFAGEDLTVEWADKDGKKQKLDFWEVCPIDDLKTFDVDKYVKDADGYEMGLQWMGGLRDDCMQVHHIENAGHALRLDIHQDKLQVDAPKSMWLPSCYTMAVTYSRADMYKETGSFHARGQVHELGIFDETTGMLVRYDPRLLAYHRGGDVDFKAFTSTIPRTYRAAVALAPTEEPSVYEGEEFPLKDKNGRPIIGKDGKPKTGKLKCVYIGGKNREGTVYSALHATYDRGMKKARGYGLTDEEADDMIFTDIIGQAIANNTQDWVMSLGKSMGSQINYGDQKSYVKGAEEWGARFGFCVKVRCKLLDDKGQPQFKDGKVVIAEQTFYNYNKLIDYVNKRIKLGDLDGVNQQKKVSDYQGVDKKAADEIDGNMFSDEGESTEGEKRGEERLIVEYAKVLRGIFGDKAEEFFEEFLRNGTETKIAVTVGKKKESRNLIEYIDNLLKSAAGKAELRKHQKEWGALIPMTPENEVIISNIVAKLRDMGDMTSLGKVKGKEKDKLTKKQTEGAEYRAKLLDEIKKNK